MGGLNNYEKSSVRVSWNSVNNFDMIAIERQSGS